MTDNVRKRSGDPSYRTDAAADARIASTQGNALTAATPVEAGSEQASSAPSQVVFIEGNVPDAQSLADGVAPGVQAVILNPDSDGAQQIAAWLVSNSVKGLSGIDIVAQGADGQMILGTTTLSAATLPQYASALATIGAAVAPGGAIQLYSSDIAYGAKGVAFVNALSVAAGGVSVAAASHLVGAAALGGSWALNVDVGKVSTLAPFKNVTEQNYKDILYAPPVTTLVSFKATANAYPGVSLIDISGDVFGTTNGDGKHHDGTVFEIAKTAGGYDSQTIVLASFNGTDGENPQDGLIADASGDLFGTTAAGGKYGDGALFEIKKDTGGGVRVQPDRTGQL